MSSIEVGIVPSALWGLLANHMSQCDEEMQDQWSDAETEATKDDSPCPAPREGREDVHDRSTVQLAAPPPYQEWQVAASKPALSHAAALTRLAERKKNHSERIKRLKTKHKDKISRMQAKIDEAETRASKTENRARAAEAYAHSAVARATRMELDSTNAARPTRNVEELALSVEATNTEQPARAWRYSPRA